MTRSEKAQRVLEILGELYPKPPIPLQHEDPFSLLVAVLLSAQCTDERVNIVTPELFRRYPVAADYATADESELEDLIRSTGFFRNKTRSLIGLGRALVERHEGQVPDSMDALVKLPGVGRKTANVVLGTWFSQPAIPVDTHIHRLAARWGLSKGRSVEQTERDLKAIFPPETWGWLHLAIIYFGREHCPARGHDLEVCPICSWASTARRKREEKRAGGGGPKSLARRAGAASKARGGAVARSPRQAGSKRAARSLKPERGG